MLKKIKSRQLGWLSVIMLVAFFVFTPLRLERFLNPNILADDSENNYYSEYDGFQYIEGGEVIWGKGDHLIEKGLYVSDGGVLRIEKGARILFANEPGEYPEIQIGVGGRIIANGTQDEKIIFSSVSGDGVFNIMIDTYDSEISAEPSFFRYVDFVGSKLTDDSGGNSAFIRNLFVNTAKAAEERFLTVLSYSSGIIHIENSTFRNASIDANSFVSNYYNRNGFLEIVNSNFEMDEKVVALDSTNLRCHESISVSDCNKVILLKNNWYGSSLGPRIEGSIISDGVALKGKYLLDGFRFHGLISDPVVVVPGIMGAGQFLGKWQLDPITHIYDDLVSSLEKNGFVKNMNLFDFPYDWRNNNETSAHYLQSRIEGIINETKVSKVDVVAHSMGGLVARAYIEDVGGIKYENTINKFVTLGTPQKGSPAAYLKWEGEGFFTWSEKISKHHFKQEAEHAGYDDLGKYIQEKVTSVKQLLPDYNYLFDVASGKMREYPENYPRNTFLEELNSKINLEKLKKVKYVNIIGNLEDNDSTVLKIRLVKSSLEGKWKNGMPENFYDSETDRGLEKNNGDETVPLYSAQSVPAEKTIEVRATHSDLPDKAQCIVFQELTGKEDCEFVDNWHATNLLLINVFSPVDIQVISPSDKRVGKNFETGEEFNEIEGAYYTGFETENEFVTIPNPEDGEYKILTKGTGDGAYRIEATKIEEQENFPNASESIVVFQGIAENDEDGKELRIEVKKNEIIDKNAEVVLPVVDPPIVVVAPVLPPVLTVPQSISPTMPVAVQKKSKKKKSKKHKKKKKTVLTQAKKVLGVSASKCKNSKSLACKATKNVATKYFAPKTSPIFRGVTSFFGAVKNYASNSWNKIFGKK